MSLEADGCVTSMENKKRVALLVLAHCAPLGLETLSKVFDDDRFCIYVHLDLKVDRSSYEFGRRWNSRTRFVDERYEIFWGGFNMVRATEALIRLALADETIGTCVLLSDDSLPLSPPSEIFQELIKEPNRIDVGMYRRNPTFLKRYTCYFYLDSHATSARPLDVGSRQVDGIALEAWSRLILLRQRGKYPIDEVWGGSQWWSMSRAMLQTILEELSCNVWLRESLEFSAVPDEIAFQTLYAQFKNLKARSFSSLMLTDMGRQPCPYIFSQARELPASPPGKLFVRKIANIMAPNVMEEISASWSKN